MIYADRQDGGSSAVTSTRRCIDVGVDLGARQRPVVDSEFIDVEDYSAAELIVIHATRGQR